MLDQLENIVAAPESMLTESLGFRNGPDDNSSEKLEAAIVLPGHLIHRLRLLCHGFLLHRNYKNRVGNSFPWQAGKNIILSVGEGSNVDKRTRVFQDNTNLSVF